MISLTKNPNHNYALDSWRGIACLMIFWHHTGTALVISPIVIFGFSGVHLFFVLSGYLIFRPFLSAILANKPFPSITNFYYRRFLRIIPCYLVALTCYTIIRYLTHQKVPDTFNLITHIFLIFNYFPSIDIYSINGVVWTLAIEAQFYVLMPLVILLISQVFRIKGVRGVKVIISFFLIVGIIARIIEFQILQNVQMTGSYVNFRTVFSFFDMFGFGMLTAYLETIPNLFKQHSIAMQSCLLIASIILFMVSNNWSYSVSPGDWMNAKDLVFTAMFPILMCLGIAILLFLFTASPLKKTWIMNQRPLIFIGQISYSLYLYHIGVQFVLFKFFSFGGIVHNFYLRGFLDGLIFLPPSLLLAYIMYLLVEKPSLRWIELIRRK